jgi:hypothetical protein
MSTRRVSLFAILAIAIVLLVSAIRWQPAPEEPEGGTTGLQVLVIGVDGLDWYLVAKYAEAGRLPMLGRMLRGSISAEIAADMPPVPHVGWTLLGRGSSLTDAEAAVFDGDGGGRLFATGPELAEHVVRAGGSVLTVGWPGTWPASPEAGLVIAPYSPASSAHVAALAPAIFEGAPGQTSVADLDAKVDRVVAEALAEYETEFEERILELARPAGTGWRDHVVAARWSFVSDSITLELCAKMMAETEPDLTLVCLGGLDAIAHRFTAPASPDLFADMPASFLAYEDVLPNYYDYVDGAIDRLVRLADDRTLILICSTYGTPPVFDIPRFSGSHEQVSREDESLKEAVPGVLIVRGPDLVRTATAPTISTLDLAPTVLAALGLPIPDHVDGRIVNGILPEWLLQRHPPDYVSVGERAPSHDPADGPPEEIHAMEELVRERLVEISTAMAR